MNTLTKIQELKSQIAYLKTDVVPHYDTMELWERKEYIGLLADYQAELVRCENHVSAHPEVFA